MDARYLAELFDNFFIGFGNKFSFGVKKGMAQEILVVDHLGRNVAAARNDGGISLMRHNNTLICKHKGCAFTSGLGAGALRNSVYSASVDLHDN
jgi:hypothetical protein